MEIIAYLQAAQCFLRTLKEPQAGNKCLVDQIMLQKTLKGNFWHNVCEESNNPPGGLISEIRCYKV